MKQTDRVIATVGVAAGCALIAYVAKDACSACVCMIFGMLCIWDGAA